MLEGARDISERALKTSLQENSMAVTASSLYLMDKLKGRKVVVFLPYSDRLKTLSEWFCQLWAESLAKKEMEPPPILH